MTALSDSHVDAASAKDFSNASLFHEDGRQAAYGTMELNQFVLDGSRKIFPLEQPADVPYWSDEKSDIKGLYVKNPMLEVSFSKVHSSIGLSLYFAEDIPAEIMVTWYTLYGSKLDSATFYPDSKEYFCKHHVQNYGKIVIEFIRSSFPCRYVKMDYIEYGQMWTLGKDNIKSANVYEEIDPTSATLSINTAQIEIIDTNNDFELSNQKGLWKSLQKEQEINLTEYVNGKSVNCGTFYIDNWSSQKNTAKFSLIDIIGVMDKTQFYGGRIYTDEYAGVIISEIMTSAGVKKYFVDEEVYYTKLSGWLAIQSHRAALQQVVFACGAVADCSRSDWVKIYRSDRYVSHTIGIDRRFHGTTKVSLDDYVSSVSVAYNRYVLKTEGEQISDSVLPVGKTRIEFSEPYLPSSIVASAGNIIEVNTNYIVVSMTEEEECILSGRKYEAIESSCTVSVPIIEAGETANAKVYSGCTMIDAVMAKNTAEKILDYYQFRQQVDMKFINEGEAVGNWCDVALISGGYATTEIISQTLDLTGGNIATAKCYGYSKNITNYYFAGTEVYAGEEGIM